MQNQKVACTLKELVNTTQNVVSVSEIDGPYGPSYICKTEDIDFWANTALKRYIEANPAKRFTCSIHEPKSFDKGGKTVSYFPIDIH